MKKRKLRKKAEENFPSAMAKQLYHLRYTANRTQSDVAEYLGINRSTYAYYELGKPNPA